MVTHAAFVGLTVAKAGGCFADKPDPARVPVLLVFSRKDTPLSATSSHTALPLTRALQDASWAVKVVAVLLGSAFIAAAAQIEVPMVPVPMTMQTFAVLTVGALFGWRLAGLTLLAYVGEGLAGLPVFAGGGSLATILVKPTTVGYIAGFVAAAVFVGALSDRGLLRGPLAAFAAMLAGTAVIYLLGLPWLASLIGWEKAIAFGAVPFLLGDLLKAALAAAVCLALGRIRAART